MKTKKKILWIIWFASVLGLGVSFTYEALNSEISVLNIIFFVFVVIQLPLIEYLNRRAIEKGKKEFNITGDVTAEELGNLRIERDYQEKIAQKFKH